MNEEIKKWLIENLSIEIDTESDWENKFLVVYLKLEDKVISSDSVYFG